MAHCPKSVVIFPEHSIVCVNFFIAKNSMAGSISLHVGWKSVVVSKYFVKFKKIVGGLHFEKLSTTLIFRLQANGIKIGPQHFQSNAGAPSSGAHRNEGGGCCWKCRTLCRRITDLCVRVWWWKLMGASPRSASSPFSVIFLSAFTSARVLFERYVLS